MEMEIAEEKMGPTLDLASVGSRFICYIRLVRTDGVEPVGLYRGFLRWVGMEISGIVLLLGYAWILVDKKKQAWHDRIAGTYVVRA